MSTVIVKERYPQMEEEMRQRRYHRRSPPQGGLREAQRSPQEESGSRAQTLLQIIPSEPTKRRPMDVVFFYSRFALRARLT